MGGQAESTGVSDTLAINDEYVRLALEFFDGGDANGGFTKGQQAGDLGEGNLS